MRADQQMALMLDSLKSLEEIVAHKELSNQSLTRELSRLSAHANVSLRKLGEEIVELKSSRHE